MFASRATLALASCPLSTLRRDMSDAKPVRPVANPVGQIELAKRRGSVLLTDYTCAHTQLSAERVVAEEANVTRRPISHAYLTYYYPFREPINFRISFAFSNVVNTLRVQPRPFAET